jgi:AcrR family transcriptional regulator
MTSENFTSDPTWPYSRAKTAVLSAASAVIREDGPRSATLKNIASRAGITEPAIFRHFEGVDGLFGGLFSVYERIYGSSIAAYSTEVQGLERLRAAVFALVDNIAASRDFAYILIYARHVFRGYPELKAKVAQNDSKDQAKILACISEGIKSGEIRSEIDPVSAAVALVGSIYITSVIWIESGFSFGLCEVFADRWDDFERNYATKPAAKSRDAKAAARERSAAFFPLRLQSSAKTKASSGKKDSKAKSKAVVPGKGAKPAKNTAGSKAAAAKAAPKRQAKVAAKAVAKKPSIKSK